MGPDQAARKLADLDELSRLNESIDSVADLNALKPIFYRLEEIVRLHPGDAAIANATATVRARLVAHGQRMVDAGQMTSSHAAAAPPPPLIPTAQAPVYSPPPLPQPPPTQQAAPARQPAGFNWKRAVAVGAVMGGLIFSGIVYSVHKSRQLANDPKNSPTSVLEVKTNPPGAAIRIGTEERCKSNCKLDLLPGDYQIQALLAGHESAISTVKIGKGTPAALEFTLVPVTPSIRFFTDLTAGKVSIDNAPAGDLIDGQFVIEKAPAGKHTLKVAAPSGEASLEFEMEPGKLPRVNGAIAARNMVGFAIANSGGAVKIWSSAVNLKASLDKSPGGTVEAQGLELQNLTPGEHELILADGPEQRKFQIAVGGQPALTVLIKLDINAGTIIVSTGEDGASVTVNGRPMTAKTTRGQLRLGGVPVGEYTINAAKDGFEAAEPQKVTVKKGDESKVAFKLKPLLKFAALHLRGAAPGTTVLLDGQASGAVSADGSFSLSNVAPGEHAIELRRGGFTSKRFSRPFRAGEAIELSGVEVLLEKAGGSIRLAVTPADARVTIKKSDEPQPRNINPGALNLSEGVYNITARAANYTDKTVTVQIAPGDNKSVDLVLTRIAAAAPVTPAAPAVKAGTMANWDAPGEWYAEEGVSLHKGGNPAFAMTPTAGIWSFDFVLKKGKALKWFFDYQDSKSFIFYQLEPKKDFIRKDGKGAEFRTAHGLPMPAEEPYRYQVQVEVTKTSIVTRVNGRILDSYTPGRDPSTGKFGLQVPRADVFGLANFRFQPR